ncbi:MAG: UTP--glucose-1-phosphate uridylyltransferase GalU [Bdellovibrio sp.]|jgi:UTP--glucose-1-phosphate uridylyltransferase
MSKVKKAIIPAAGLGTRFLPATKTVPKEMLTIVDAPIIFYVVEEAIQAGIEDIVLIQGRGKSAIEDFFDTSYELEDKLMKDGKIHLHERLVKIRDMANIISVRQKQPLGLGHAVLCGQKVVGREAFAVLLGDEIMVQRTSEANTIARLKTIFDETQSSTVAVMEVSLQDVSKYGVADVEKEVNGRFRVKGFVEKPRPEVSPSRWALPGRYVFSPDIFDELLNGKPGALGEIQLTDSMNALAKKQAVFASQFSSARYDAGDKLGYLRANIELGLDHPELGYGLRKYLLEELLPLLKKGT